MEFKYLLLTVWFGPCCPPQFCCLLLCSAACRSASNSASSSNGSFSFGFWNENCHCQFTQTTKM